MGCNGHRTKKILLWEILIFAPLSEMHVCCLPILYSLFYEHLNGKNIEKHGRWSTPFPNKYL